MIPDKIYLGIQDLGSGYVYALSLDNNGEQEYIRKEALLKWMKEELDKRRDTGNDYFYPAIVVLEDLINKINSL